MTDFLITLDVKDSTSSAETKYHNVGSTSGKQYSFRYQGGSDGEGGINEIVGSGSSKITVTVNNYPRYEINSIQFDDNDANDLSCEISADKSSLVITDTDADNMEGYYKVMVKDTHSPQSFLWCDPPIRNRTGNN